MGIHVGKNLVYNDLNLEPNSFTYKEYYVTFNMILIYIELSRATTTIQRESFYIVLFRTLQEIVQHFRKIIFPGTTLLVAFIANTKFQTSDIVCVCSCHVPMCKRFVSFFFLNLERLIGITLKLFIKLLLKYFILWFFYICKMICDIIKKMYVVKTKHLK